MFLYSNSTGVFFDLRKEPTLLVWRLITLVPNVLTVDIEEYFHAQALRRAFGKEWLSLAKRCAREVSLLLDLFDKTGQRATFFSLGWIAEKEPDILKEVARRGHEIGCHGFDHANVSNMTVEEFRRDVERSCEAISKASGRMPAGYRAPVFTLSPRKPEYFKVLVDLGFKYDSSVFPTVLAGLIPALLPRKPWEVFPGLIELPLAVAKFGVVRVPVAGGIFFRTLPYQVTRAGIKELNSRGLPAVMYFHPWEFDIFQPKPKRLGIVAYFRHYTGISQNLEKFQRLLSEFRFCAAEDLIRTLRISAGGSGGTV